jgi:hypothetical protein
MATLAITEKNRRTIDARVMPNSEKVFFRSNNRPSGLEADGWESADMDGRQKEDRAGEKAPDYRALVFGTKPQLETITSPAGVEM